ncbi:MAG: sugar phosphate isomerase/epimerase [Planctomycetaceae bacterium]|nr:sugar phosphate isomerase/epimerase [Planctomycetaceae bacterium]
MIEKPRVILSGFADEAANNKTAVEQFAVFAALGLQYYSIRFINLGDGVKNVMKLNRSDIQKIRQLQDEYGLNVSSIGSPIGKIKLEDANDGTPNIYVPFETYLENDVRIVCELAHAFETKLIRGFSFYHPKGKDPRQYVAQVADRIGQIAEMCHRHDLTFGIEVEANLVGQNGLILADIYKQVNHPAITLIFDGANLVTQGYDLSETFEQYHAMKPGLGWFHVKDYVDPKRKEKGGYVEEDTLSGFVPCDMGISCYEMGLRDFAAICPQVEARLRQRGIPGVFLDLEPHLKGGGQFGGFSGPDGMGVALRSLCRMLDYIGFDYHLRDFDDIKASRGF